MLIGLELVGEVIAKWRVNPSRVNGHLKMARYRPAMKGHLGHRLSKIGPPEGPEAGGVGRGGPVCIF